jgi:hypothetical protein
MTESHPNLQQLKPHKTNSSTLSLHNKVGDGNIAEVLNGVVIDFISFKSAECKKASSLLFPTSLDPKKQACFLTSADVDCLQEQSHELRT